MLWSTLRMFLYSLSLYCAICRNESRITVMYVCTNWGHESLDYQIQQCYWIHSHTIDEDDMARTSQGWSHRNDLNLWCLWLDSMYHSWFQGPSVLCKEKELFCTIPSGSSRLALISLHLSLRMSMFICWLLHMSLQRYWIYHRFKHFTNTPGGLGLCV